MKKSIVLTALALSVAAPVFGQAPKDDFIGLSFNATQADLEKAGYVCKKEEKSEFTCVNLDWKGRAFGREVNKARFVRHLDKAGTSISVELDPVPTSLGEISATRSDLDQLYTRDKKSEVMTSSLILFTWDRPDGAMLRFMYMPGTRMFPASSSFVVRSKG